MAYGDGEIKEILQKNGKSHNPRKWRVRVYKGKDPATKKPIRITRTVCGTLAQARAVRDELRAEPAKSPGLVSDGSMTFGDFADRWHERRVIKNVIGSNRQDVENYLLDGLKEFVGDVPLREITPQMCEDCLFAIRNRKIEGGGRCSSTTLRMHYTLLRQVLAAACDRELISRNPADKIEAPKVDTPEIKPLSRPESQRLLAVLDCAETDAYVKRGGIERRRAERGDASFPKFLRGMSGPGRLLAVRLSLLAGLRRGEALALRWGDVDLVHGKIHVVASLTPKGELKDPKSRASRRRISIGDDTVSHLARWKEFQREEFGILSMLQTDLTPVCCSDVGGFMCPNNLERWWRSFRSDNGFDDLTIHALRHTHATQLISNGMDIKTVQYRLGHSSAAITMNLYAHFVPERDEDAAELCENLFCMPNGGQTEDGKYLCRVS